MIDLEDRKIEIGDYVFQRHEGQLNVAPCNDFLLDYDGTFAWDNEPCLSYYPVDFFSDLIDALNYYKDKGLQVKLTGEEFKQLVEGSHASVYTCNGECYGEDCENCKNESLVSCWVNFNRYDFIKDYGAFRRLVLIRDDYKCLCCGNDNEKDLQVHHIRAFKDNLELATSVKNGATLCKDCHKKYHKKYGWKGKQETFSKFIKEMLD